MNLNLLSTSKFRQDINGLRAWAVIAVLLFHFNLIGLPGGFVGVDIFFVISGYLMTVIIVRGYEKDNFSIWKFYMARARRIIPPLLVVIAVLLLLGWFWLPTPDYQTLGAQSAYSMAFLSNISYWRSTGYFDTAAEEKWLLHTWSLAVEAQFYLFYPLFISFFWKIWRSLKAVTLGVFLLFIISFLLNLIYVNSAPAGAFYLLPTRAWELCAGGLVYLISIQTVIPKWVKINGYRFGWFLTFISLFIINNEFIWPGYWAVLPVLAASLIILGEYERSKLTNNLLAQWLGERSYSLYLWHWPIIVFLDFASIKNEWIWFVIAFSTSIVLAHISYKFIEVPTRKYLSSCSLFKEGLVTGIITLSLILAAVSVKLFIFTDRIQPDIEFAALGALDKDSRREECLRSEKYCKYGDGVNGVIMIGDSHSGSLITSLRASAIASGLSVSFKGKDGCTPFIGLQTYFSNEAAKNSYTKCKDYNLKVRASLYNQPALPLVIVDRLNPIFVGPNEKLIPEKKLNSIIANKQLNRRIVINNLCELSKSREVFIIRPIPEIGVHVPNTLSRNMLFGRDNDDIKIKLEDYYQRSRYVWELQNEAADKCDLKILNPIPYLCDEQYCYGSRNRRALYFDDDHLSEYGGSVLSPMFDKIFK